MQISKFVILLAVAGTPGLCKKKPASTTSTSTTSSTRSDVSWSPQEMSAIESAYFTFVWQSLARKPEFTSFILDPITIPTMPTKAVKDISSFMNSEKSYQWIMTLPTPTSDSIATTHGSDLGLPADIMSTMPKITLAPRMSDTIGVEKRKKKPASTTSSVTTTITSATSPDSDLTPQQSSILMEAVKSWSSSVAPARNSLVSDLHSILATMPAESALKVMSMFGAPRTAVNLQAVSSVVAQLPSEDQAIYWSIQSDTDAVSSRVMASIHGLTSLPTPTSGSIVAALGNNLGQHSPDRLSIFPTITLASTVHARAATLETPSSTPVDVFTVSMTPEQSNEVDLEYNAYMHSLEDTEAYFSIASRLMTESFDETAIANFEALPTPTAASIFDARLSSALALYPSYARSLVSEIAYAEASILSQVLNRPSVNNSLSTMAANAKTTDRVPTTTTSTSQVTTTSSSSKGKAHSPTHTSWYLITPTAILNDMGWKPQQTSAYLKGVMSIASSLMRNPKALSVLGAAQTAPGMAEFTALCGPSAPCTDIKGLSSAFRQMPSSVSKLASEVAAKEMSLISKVEKMIPTSTITETRGKRQDTDSSNPYPTEVSNDDDEYFNLDDDDYIFPFAGPSVSPQKTSIYNAELNYDRSMLSQPTYSSILAEMSAAVGVGNEWQVEYFEEVGPMYPSLEYESKFDAKISSQMGSIIAAMPSDVQAFFNSVASDQASIISSVSAKFATSTKSAVNKQVVNTHVSPGATPTGKKTSAASKETLTAGVLAICLVVVMALL